MQIRLLNIFTNLLRLNLMKFSSLHLKNLLSLILLITLALSHQQSFALAEGTLLLPNVPDGIVKMTSVEPTRDVGYTVGDILKRVITLEVKKPYTLVDTSVPIVGYERRYKGQVIGIDVSNIKFSQSENDQNNIYVMDIDYQVLTNNVVAKPAALPAEVLTIKVINNKGKSDLFQYRVPSWNFRISPLAVFGSVKIEQDMSGLRGPLVLDSSTNEQNRIIALAIFGLALLGLLYILGNRAWLPRMGAPFAKALRDLRKLPNTPNGVQQAVSRLHFALNKTANQIVFHHSLDDFLEIKPAFVPLKADLITFFEVSRHTFFESTQTQTISLNWLKSFARRARDCERGLTPNPVK